MPMQSKRPVLSKTATPFPRGHSLGGAQAIYVAVLKGYHGFTYAAAGPGLSEKQLNNYEGQIINLYDTSDIVTSGWLTGGKGQLPFHSFGIDNVGWKNYGHDLNQFNLDKNGNYIDKYGDIIIYSDQHGGSPSNRPYSPSKSSKTKL